MQPRLKAEIWIKAHIRRVEVEGATAMVARRGDDMSGSVLIKLNRLDGTASVLAPAPHAKEGRIWLTATGPAAVEDREAEAFIRRQVDFDPDLWVLEIEDRQGRHFLDDPVE